MMLEVQARVRSEDGLIRVLEATVKFASDGEPSIEKFTRIIQAKARDAYKRLKPEIERVLSEKGWTVGSEYELFALTTLAAARANVNPVHVDTVSFYSPTSDGYKWNIRHVFSNIATLTMLEGEALTDIIETHLIMKGNIVSMASGRPTMLWQALDMLADVVQASLDEQGRVRDSSVLNLLSTLKEMIEAYNYTINKLIGRGDVAGIFRLAAQEARDPDFKRLAELASMIIEASLVIALHLNTLKHDIDEAVNMDQGQGHSIVLKLREVNSRLRALENYIISARDEGLTIIKRLEQRIALLDREVSRYLVLG